MVMELEAANFPAHVDALGLLEHCVYLMDSHSFICEEDEHGKLLWTWYLRALGVIETTYQLEGKRIAASALAYERMSMMGLIES